MSKKKEQWEKISSDDDIIEFFDSINVEYQVSNLGRVRKIVDGGKPEVLKLDKATRYYTFYHYIKPRKATKTFFVHKLVARAFIPAPERPEEQKFVIHLNYNRWNNQYDNLQWADKYEKERHAQKNPDRPKQKGKITYAKLNENKVILIKQMLKRKVKWKRIAAQFDISEMQIYRIKIGECWSHVKLPEEGELMADSKSERFGADNFEKDEYIEAKQP